MPQLTGRQRDTKDQFYTRPEVARTCVDRLRALVDPARSYVWIEPSAGAGAFLDCVPTAIGYDIEPRHSRVQQADFLSCPVPPGCILFGNPPFGRQGSLARAFIRHGASAADILAFILPRSFMKPSMNSVFPRCFHCIDSWDLPEDAFLVNGEPHSVPCVWQVWERRDVDRPVDAIASPCGFEFVSSDRPHTLVFRRVGVYAGHCALPGQHSPQSHYFVRLDTPSLAADLIEQSKRHVFPSNTTGPRSLSKHEATVFLNACIANATGGDDVAGN